MKIDESRPTSRFELSQMRNIFKPFFMNNLQACSRSNNRTDLPWLLHCNLHIKTKVLFKARSRFLRKLIETALVHRAFVLCRTSGTESVCLWFYQSRTSAFFGIAYLGVTCPRTLLGLFHNPLGRVRDRVSFDVKAP